MEGKLNGNYLRLIPGLCLEDRMDRQVKDGGGWISIRGQVV